VKKEDFQEMAEVERLRRELERANKTVSEMAGLHDVVREVILSALRDVQPPAMPKMPARSRRKRKEIAVIHLSDWQIGALTDSYNLTVAREMILGQLLDVVTKLVAERRVVSLGLVDDDWAEVQEGVDPGDSVVTVGQSHLRDGARIRAQEQAESAEVGVATGEDSEADPG